VNLGGGPRPQPKSSTGVNIYLHDWFGSGKHAQVVSVKSAEFKADAAKFRPEPPLTGDESRVTEVSNVEFPQLLSPVDDLPPTCVVTHVVREGRRLTLRGVAADNGEIVRVTINGQPVKSLDGNFAQWEWTTDSGGEPLRLEIVAEDKAGNREQRPSAPQENALAAAVALKAQP
jgi:hypothetical protein